MQDRIVATSSQGDIGHGKNGIRAVQGGFSISKRMSGDDLGVALIGKGADISSTRWVLKKTQRPNVYEATPA